MKVVEMKTNMEGLTSYSSKFSFAASSMQEEEKLNLQPYTTYVAPLIPVPKGYRLLTEEDKAKYGKLDIWEHCQFFDNIAIEFSSFSHQPDNIWHDNIIYVIREDWTPEPKIELTVTINGKAVDPSTISKEKWNNLRGGGSE